MDWDLDGDEILKLIAVKKLGPLNEELADKSKRRQVDTVIEQENGKNILKIDIENGVLNIIEYIQKNIDHIDEVIIYASNRSYSDFSKLREINKDIKVNYIDNEFKFLEPISLDDFLEMREYIDSVVKTIKAKSLSPVEEIMYLYEYVKWYSYNVDEGRENHVDEATYIHDILKTGQIICGGYSRLFAQIAKELGHNAFVCQINSYESFDGIGHDRNAIFVDDDRYDIHGIYYLDATFDSTSHVGLNEKYGAGLEEANLFLQCFLFTKDQWKALFPYHPVVEIEDVDHILPFVQDDFREKVSEEELVKEREEIPFDKIKTIFRNVKLKEGYSEKQVTDLLNLLEKHNSVQEEILRENGASSGFHR